MTDQHDSFDYLGVTISPCRRDQSKQAGEEWYVASVNQFTRQEDPEDACLRYRTKDDAMAAVDTLIDMEKDPAWTPQTAT